MLRVVATLLALSFVPTALADGGPSPGAARGGLGVLGGNVRYVAIGTGRTTELVSIRANSGQLAGWVTFRGFWGVPTVAYDGTTGGLSYDHSTLVLGQVNPWACAPASCTWSTSRFAVFTPNTLRWRETVVLPGRFTYDALSPDGRTLYLIQYVSRSAVSRYLVRAYDLAHGRLLPQAIADRTQRGWAMVGSPMTRTTSADGRFVYTLYQNPGGYPFVHALDAVRRVAHCIGLPWLGDQNSIGSMRLKLGDGGRTLLAAGPGVAQSFAIDTTTYRVSEPTPGSPGGFPWWTLGLLGLPLLAVGALFAARRRDLRVMALPGR
jgi:hypothetical protein